MYELNTQTHFYTLIIQYTIFLKTYFNFCFVQIVHYDIYVSRNEIHGEWYNIVSDLNSMCADVETYVEKVQGIIYVTTIFNIAKSFMLC